jgi:hypothetical protein
LAGRDLPMLVESGVVGELPPVSGANETAFTRPSYIQLAQCAGFKIDSGTPVSHFLLSRDH